MRFNSNRLKIKPVRFEPVMNKNGFFQNFKSNHFFSNRTEKFQIYNFLYFLQFLELIGHDESEYHGPVALGIIKRDILALFQVKCLKKGKE